jgi:23S rRNA (cytidine1920-2'-O)/16S rRNA (cytidine1409-2'-O)-methyltransferase
MRRRKLEVVLVERGLARDLTDARDLIDRKIVFVNGAVGESGSRMVADGDQLVINEPSRFVSRGGEKLDHALESFGIDVAGRIGVDLGSSTGGFTDCLLQRGALHVYAVDVGEHLLHERIAHDERVTELAGVNVKDVGRLPEDVAEVVVVDLSFISATAAIPAIVRVAGPGTDVIVLVKPQFEATREEADRHAGVIRDAAIHTRVLAEVSSAFEAARYAAVGMVESPIRGGKGNREFLVWYRRLTHTS